MAEARVNEQNRCQEKLFCQRGGLVRIGTIETEPPLPFYRTNVGRTQAVVRALTKNFD